MKTLILSAVLSVSFPAAAAPHGVVVVEQAHGTVGFYASEPWTRLGEVRVGAHPHEIEVSPDESRAWVTNFGIQDYDETIGTPGSTVSELDLGAMVETRQLSTFPDLAPHGVKLRPGRERELYVNTEKPARMLVFDLGSGAVKKRFDVDAKTHNFVFSSDGGTLWLMAGPSGILAVDPETGAVRARHALSTPVRGLALTADGKRLVAAGKNEIELLDAATLGVVRRFADLGVGQILYAVPSPDGRYVVAPAVWDSTVLVIETETGRVVAKRTSGLDPVAVSFAPDGSAAYVSNARDHGLSRLDLATMALERVATAAGPNGLAATVLVPKVSSRAKLRFAAVLPLSGRDASFGREMMLGYEMWKSDVNARGGVFSDERAYAIEIRYLDSESNGAAVEALAAGAVREGARYLLGSYGTPDNGAVARVAARAQIPLVTSAGAGRSLYEQGNRFLFGIMAPASEYLIGSVAVAAAQAPAPTKVVVLSSDAPAPLEDARNAARYAESLGMAPIAVEGMRRDPSGVAVYAAGEGDFAQIAARLAAAGADFVLMAGDTFDAMALVRASKAISFAPKAFAFSVGPSVPLFASAMGLGADAQHMIGATQWTPAANVRGAERYASAQAFGEAFWEAYNARPSYLSAGAYATGLVFEAALRRAGSAPLAVRDALAVTDHETFYGRVRFAENGLNETKPIYTIQLDVAGTRVKERLLGPGGEAPVWPFPGWGR